MKKKKMLKKFQLILKINKQTNKKIKMEKMLLKNNKKLMSM